MQLNSLPSFFGNDNVQKLKNERDFRALIKRLKKVTTPELGNDVQASRGDA